MNEYDNFWNNETDIADLGIDQPDWIIQTLSPYNMISIYQGGCESGAYMPAVTYYQAKNTMNDYGDEVFDYLEQMTGEIPKAPNDTSWSGMAVFYLSYAVELWVSSNMDEVENAIEDNEE